MTAGLSVEAISLALGDFRLKKIDFAVSRGETLMILGPNGAGKSVTLETIAGFHRPESGRVLIGGRDVTALPPEQRKVGYVVQNFGLFPHLSVAHNVAIARHRGPARAGAETVLPSQGDAAALLDYFGIAHLARRSPADLSPGESQRVALARALAAAPDLFLFDEPFSSLDAETHEHLREELKSYLRALAIPAIFVSHDRIDAMTLADRVVVLRDGAVVQSGSPAEVFNKPANVFVARLTGVENVLSGRVMETSNGLLTIAVGNQVMRAVAPAAALRPDGVVFLSVRGEDVVIDPARQPAPAKADTNRLHGQIARLRVAGPLACVTVDCGLSLNAYMLRSQVPKMALEEGSQITMEIAPEAIHVMPE